MPQEGGYTQSYRQQGTMEELKQETGVLKFPVFQDATTNQH